MKKIEINCETGEEILLDCTEEEIAAAKAAYLQEQAYLAEKAAQRQAVLNKLGLTAEEMVALLA